MGLILYSIKMKPHPEFLFVQITFQQLKSLLIKCQAQMRNTTGQSYPTKVCMIWKALPIKYDEAFV